MMDYMHFAQFLRAFLMGYLEGLGRSAVSMGESRMHKTHHFVTFPPQYEKIT